MASKQMKKRGDAGKSEREEQSPAAAESSSQQQWLATLSEPELDLLISFKGLAATRATTAGHPNLADKFDLRTLRALGVVLLENFKERLKEISIYPNNFHRPALVSDFSDADSTNSGRDSEVVRPNEDQPKPIGVKRKGEQMQDVWHDEVARGQKKRKMNETRYQ